MFAKKSFVSVLEGRPESDDETVLEVAESSRNLMRSTGRCPFCGAKLSAEKMSALSEGWDAMQLVSCECLAPLRCVDYIEFDKKPTEVLACIKSGALPLSAPLYQGICVDCKKNFTVPVKVWYKVVMEGKKYARQRRCWTCRAKLSSSRKAEQIANQKKSDKSFSKPLTHNLQVQVH